jgi:hypothetical protein
MSAAPERHRVYCTSVGQQLNAADRSTAAITNKKAKLMELAEARICPKKWLILFSRDEPEYR